MELPFILYSFPPRTRFQLLDIILFFRPEKPVGEVDSVYPEGCQDEQLQVPRTRLIKMLRKISTIQRTDDSSARREFSCLRQGSIGRGTSAKATGTLWR